MWCGLLRRLLAHLPTTAQGSTGGVLGARNAQTLGASCACRQCARLHRQCSRLPQPVTLIEAPGIVSSHWKPGFRTETWREVSLRTTRPFSDRLDRVFDVQQSPKGACHDNGSGIQRGRKALTSRAQKRWTKLTG